MQSPHGTPIWYELLTNDSSASEKFYGEVLGWKLTPARPDDPKHYQAIDTGTGLMGGVLQLNDEMKKNGAKPTWLFYIGVDDVDASVTKIEELGGKVLMKPFDIPNAGRVAMVADPQGIPFYVMRGAVDAPSTAFGRRAMGKCSWNELYTPDHAAANDFYAKAFGWTYPDKMPMGEMGDYVFVHVGEEAIGATMKTPPQAGPGWQFYFRQPDIDAAAERVKKAGGAIFMGPQEVPGGEKIVVAADPAGVIFGIVAAGNSN